MSLRQFDGGRLAIDPFVTRITMCRPDTRGNTFSLPQEKISSMCAVFCNAAISFSALCPPSNRRLQ